MRRFGAIRNVVGQGGKRDKIENLAGECRLYDIVETSADVLRIDLFFTQMNHLRQIGFHHESQGPVGPLVKKGGLLAKTTYGITNKAQLHAGRQDRIAQFIFRCAFQTVIEGQRMEKNAPGNT